MVKITDKTQENPKVTRLSEIPTGTFFTGKIPGYDNKFFIKLGPTPAEEASDSYGSKGRILALDHTADRMSVYHSWDTPSCPVSNYRPVNVEMVLTNIE